MLRRNWSLAPVIMIALILLLISLLDRQRRTVSKSAGVARLFAASPHVGSSRGESQANELVTVVTAYWNIGSIEEGIETDAKTPALYYTYADTYMFVLNPVVVYSDDARILERFRNVRANLSTETILVNRDELWSFKLETRIAKVYSNPLYPKHHPNTVVPLYPCATHAKYDVMSLAVQSNFFNSDYFAWVDMGYWRDMYPELGASYKFGVSLPPQFDSEMVAYTEAFACRPDLSIENIYKKSYTSLTGGLFIGHGDQLLQLAEEYRFVTEKYLRQGLANTDQQVLYAMFSKYNNDTAKVRPQRYVWNQSRLNRWMYLGHLLRDEWYERHHIKSIL